MVSGESSSWLRDSCLLVLFSYDGKKERNFSFHSYKTPVRYKNGVFILIISNGICNTGSVAQLVKNLPAVQETQVQSQGQEDPQEKEMTIQSSILA